MESLGSRDLGETLVMLGPVGTRDNQAPRGIPAGLDSATPDLGGHRERKASPAHQVLREAEETLA